MLWFKDICNVEYSFDQNRKVRKNAYLLRRNVRFSTVRRRTAHCNIIQYIPTKFKHAIRQCFPSTCNVVQYGLVRNMVDAQPQNGLSIMLSSRLETAGKVHYVVMRHSRVKEM